ncbi:polysaccharide pyruvyl transferase family protein [Bacteroides propionicifaciens]|uniref:polysaccharide pyruvyl transferase family protein n=1 Tax=Bacteroides propionicifaciens TaxID=392838 RepID=UPI000364D350|nr:polysaccharide pyruvyl transferase family protein [Bacteroides propionicifaciens]
MKAIVVPGITDLNKGDQALVWESVRLIEDTNIFDEVVILSNGDTNKERDLLCSQTQNNSYKLIDHILKHPRRGLHSKKDNIKDSKLTIIKQVYYSIKDYFSRSLLIKVSQNLTLVKLLFSKKTYETVSYFHSADVIFVKGGGFIHAYGELRAPYVIWFSLFYLKLAIKLRKKTVVLPNSYGPFQGLLVKKQVRNVFEKVDLIFARESISYNSLQSILNNEVFLGKDLGFFLNADTAFDVESLLSKYSLSIKEKIVGVTIRPWRFPTSNNPEEAYQNYISSIIYFTDFLVSKGYKIAFCNQSLGPNSHEDDRNAIELVYSKYINSKNVVWINENLTCKQLKSLYSVFTYFLGTRFHSIIFSTTSMIPSIAIGYGGNKASGIMSDIGLDNLVIPIEKVNFNILQSMFLELESNTDSIVEKLKSNQKDLVVNRESIIANVKRICEL